MRVSPAGRAFGLVVIAQRSHRSNPTLRVSFTIAGELHAAYRFNKGARLGASSIKTNLDTSAEQRIRRPIRWLRQPPHGALTGLLLGFHRHIITPGLRHPVKFQRRVTQPRMKIVRCSSWLSGIQTIRPQFVIPLLESQPTAYATPYRPQKPTYSNPGNIPFPAPGHDALPVICIYTKAFDASVAR